MSACVPECEREREGGWGVGEGGRERERGGGERVCVRKRQTDRQTDRQRQRQRQSVCARCVYVSVLVHVLNRFQI